MRGTSRGKPLGIAPVRPTVAEVDLSVLRDNARHLRKLVGPGVAVYGVVKADAYGHGAVAAARALGPLVDALAVSLVEEGQELRVAGITAPILVLGGSYGKRHAEVIEAGLTPVIHDEKDLEAFASLPVRRSGRSAVPIPVHIKVDTGMSRLGFAPREIDRLLSRLRRRPRVHFQGLYTHLACADAEDPGPTIEQLRRFEAARVVVRAAGLDPVVHAANSAGLVGFPQARLDAVRPGLALYGAMPGRMMVPSALAPVMSLRTRILAIHDVAAGTGVSYGALWRAVRPSRIATLPLGYADGYPRHVTGAEVLVRGRRAKVAGAVCMDLMMIDVTDVANAVVGDTVTLFGRDGDQMISIDQMAAWAGTINYEILCGISKRVPRTYRDETARKGRRS